MFKHILIVLVVLSCVQPRSSRAASADEENAKLRQALAALELELLKLEIRHEELKTEYEASQLQVAQLIRDKKNASASKPGDKPRKARAAWAWEINSVNLKFPESRKHPGRIRAYCTFMNKSASPYKYRLKIVVYLRPKIPVLVPPILGTSIYTTRTLKPKELFKFEQLIRVSSTRSPRNIRITDIQALPAD